MLRLPGPLIRLPLAIARLADYFGLLPRKMIDADPLYASVFIANLGSINYPAGFHHLWEYGTDVCVWRDGKDRARMPMVGRKFTACLYVRRAHRRRPLFSPLAGNGPGLDRKSRDDGRSGGSCPRIIDGNIG